MKTWSFWLPDLLPHLPDCPIPVVERALLRAAQDFMRGSRIWKITLPPIPVTIGIESITIPMDADKDLVRIEEAWLDGDRLMLITPDELDGDYDDDWTLHTGTPTSLVQYVPGVVTVYPKPLSAALTGLKLKVSVRPSESAIGIIDEISVKYRDALECGALARLMAMPGKAWTNLELSAFHMQNFNAITATATADTARGFNQGRIKSRPTWA